METIIDDIYSIIQEVEDSTLKVNEVIQECNTGIRKDNITINEIKKKIKNTTKGKLEMRKSRISSNVIEELRKKEESRSGSGAGVPTSFQSNIFK